METANHHADQDCGCGFGVTASDLKAQLVDYGAQVVSGHIFPMREDNIGPIIDYYNELGASFLINPMTVFRDRDEVLKACEEYNRVGRKVAEGGMRFCYHNHFHEFQILGQEPRVLETILENTDPRYVGLELDTYWAVRGGYDPVKFIGKWHDRILAIHQKDLARDFTGPVNQLEAVKDRYTAQSARQVMEIMAEKPVDIMLCDIEMPQCSGLQLLRRLAEDHIRVVSILLTAHADFQYAREAVSLGAMDYITKPAPVAKIEEVVGRAVERVQELRRIENDARNARRWSASRGLLLRHFWSDVIAGQIGPGRVPLAQERAARNIETPLEAQYMLLCCMFRLPSDDRSGLAAEEVSRCVQEELAARLEAEAVVARQDMWIAVLPGTGGRLLEQRKDAAMEALETLNEAHQLYLMGCLVDGVPVEDIPAQVRLVHRRVHDRVDECRLLVFERPLRALPEATDRADHRAFAPAPFDTWQKMLCPMATERLIAQVYTYLYELGAGEPVPEATLSSFLHDYLQMVYSALKEAGIHSASLMESDDTLRVLFSRATTGLNDLRNFCGHITARCTRMIAAAQGGLSVSEKISRYVNGHLGESLDRDSIAAYVGFSPEYVSRLFKQETGLNLVNFVQTMRLNAACRLLLDTNLSVSDIAAQVGYDNFAYFSKAFRKHTGENPSAYRKGH